MASTKPPSKPASKPPSRHHYVRINGPEGVRVYATNLSLRELAPLLVQDSVSEALSRKGKGVITARFTAGKGKNFTVRFDRQKGEAHLQMVQET